MDVIQTAGTGRHGNSCSVARGPVCGVMVDTHTVKRRHTHHGDPFYFCASDCLEEFAANPTLYLKSELRSAKPSPEGKPVPEGTIYTCPMHPEIRKAGPGSCPICGMALEPELASAGRRQIQSSLI